MEIQFITKLNFSCLFRVKPLHKQINKGSLKRKINPTTHMVSSTSQWIVFMHKGQVTIVQLQANCELCSFYSLF